MTKDELRAALRQKIDAWIESGARTHEPAIALLAAQTFPPDVRVYDDAITRAGQPPIARLYLERAMLLMGDFSRQDDHLADLERAYKFAGDDKDIRGIAARTMAQHHADFLDDYDKAIPFMHEAIELNAARTEAEVALQTFDRGLLASWLEKRGDRVAAIAIRTDLASVGDARQRHHQLRVIVSLHIRGGDLTAAEETCKQMTEPLASTAEAWLALLEADPEPERAKRAIAALVRCWPDPEARRAIQRTARSARLLEAGKLLAPLFDAAFLPLADAGLAESRAIEDKLLAEPDGHLVLADELTRRGDLRGELIVVQQKLETEPENAELLQRQEQLIEENAFRWLGPLEPPRVRWRRGYVRHAEHFIMREATLGDLAFIVSHPSLRFLEELTIQVADDPTTALLDAAAGLRRLAKLVIGIWTPRTDDQRAQLTAALPNIEFAGR